MPWGGTRSVNGSCGFGRCACTAFITSAVACGPVTARTRGCIGVRLSLALLGAEAAGDDDLAVFGQRLADRVERFLHRRIDEAAGVHDDEVGTRVGRGRSVALGAQLREDAFGIDQRLGTAQRDKSDLGRRGRHLSASLALPALPADRSAEHRGTERPENMLRAWLCICSCNCANMLLALLDVVPHQALHRGALQVHELGPQVLRGARVVAVHALRLLLQRFLDVLERAHVALQIPPIMPCIALP